MLMCAPVRPLFSRLLEEIVWKRHRRSHMSKHIDQGINVNPAKSASIQRNQRQGSRFFAPTRTSVQPGEPRTILAFDCRCEIGGSNRIH
jgi:hypothetical protein